MFTFHDVSIFPRWLAMAGPDLDALFGEEDESLSPQAEMPCQVPSEIRKIVSSLIHVYPFAFAENNI